MKRFFQRHKRILYAAGSVALIALIFLVSGTPGFVSTAAATKKLPIYSVQRDDKRVSLTFDAAVISECGSCIFNALRVLY